MIKGAEERGGGNCTSMESTVGGKKRKEYQEEKIWKDRKIQKVQRENERKV